MSLPAANYYEIVEATRAKLGSEFDLPDIITTGYGHIGDGNLHLNVSLKGYEDKELQAKVSEATDDFVMNYVREYKGSVSAEHGVGLQKPKYLHYSKSAGAIKLMHSIKNSFDPNGIMNPYKVLP